MLRYCYEQVSAMLRLDAFPICNDLISLS